MIDGQVRAPFRYRSGLASPATPCLSGVAILALALWLALIFLVADHPDRFITADAIGYNRLALNLVQRHGFSMGESAPYEPDNSRTPGYPVFVALVYAMAGYIPTLVLAAQAIVSGLTCAVIYGLGKRLADGQTDLIAALLLAVRPISITYSALLWSDTLFTLLLTVGVWLAVMAWQRESPKWAAASGACLGVATLVHPRSLFLGPLVAGLLTGTQADNASICQFLVAGSTTSELWQSLWQSLTLATGLIIVADSVLLLAIYLTAAYAVWLGRGSAQTYALLGIIAYLALVGGPASGSRFRLAFAPLLVVLAATGLRRLVRAWPPASSPGCGGILPAEHARAREH